MRRGSGKKNLGSVSFGEGRGGVKKKLVYQHFVEIRPQLRGSRSFDKPEITNDYFTPFFLHLASRRLKKKKNSERQKIVLFSFGEINATSGG